jgi:hypothetical protein
MHPFQLADARLEILNGRIINFGPGVIPSASPWIWVVVILVSLMLCFLLLTFPVSEGPGTDRTG